jgi:hypothetical protein
LLAVIVKAEGVLERPRFERALATWNQHRFRREYRAFGQVLLDLDVLKPSVVKHLVHLQRKLAVPPGRRMPLGLIAVEGGALRPSQLVDLLDRQADSNLRLGDLLVRENILRRVHVDALLLTQRAGAAGRG